MTAEAGTAQTFESILGQIRGLAFKYIQDKDYTSAQLAFKKLLELDNKDLTARYVYAQLIDDGSHKKRAEARDLMLSILDENPSIFEHPTVDNLDLIRNAAVRCSHVGPFPKAIELFRKLAHGSNLASDYYQFSEILTKGNFFEESISSLEKAVALDPANFDTPANRETIELSKSQLNRTTAKAANSKATVGRYPETADFLGDFQKLMRDHIAVNLKGEEKFVNKNTRFFTMGSCFARNLANSLSSSGYVSHHMEISEYINTTFANKVFVDWLSGAEIDDAIRDRIVELLPPGWSKEIPWRSSRAATSSF